MIVESSAQRSTILPLVEIHEVTKRFGSLVAVDRVDLDIRASEVHAILGENGAGKTTLMNVLTGLLKPDSGRIFLDGSAVSISSPRKALELGIGIVHQHFRLVENFTAAENLHLGWNKTPRLAGNKDLVERTVSLAKQFDLEVDPTARIWQMSVGEQQRVAILRTLARGARVLILDEPTAVLTPAEADRLFEMLRGLALGTQRAVIFISHKLNEVIAVSDRVTVLRAGRRVDTMETADCNQELLAQMMIGRHLGTQPAPPAKKLGPAVLVARKISARNDRGLSALEHLDLELRSGEIVGVAGVAGNGQRELSEVLTGLRAVDSGQVLAEERDLTNAYPVDFLRAGVGHIPEDRYSSGLVISQSIEHNAVLRAFRDPPIRRGPFLITTAIQSYARRLVDAVKISISDLGSSVRALSGGNAQRLLTGREIAAASKALVAVHPTRGLDVAAAEAVRQALLDARDSGVGILLISEDLAELLSLSDRIAVMYRGQLTGEFDKNEYDINVLGLLMGGGPAEPK